ncbi:MAG: Crp/Fnr family transcriptional regulator [Cycloclasticus sp.]|nr:Crp/Fnr family transcriptional regulator [Cycloclasticus sp.]
MESLRKNLLFSTLDQQQFNTLVEHSSRLQVSDGEHLFHQKEAANYFFLLETGNIKLYRLSPSGEEKVIELIHQGQTFAEAVMFMQGGTYPVNAQALSDCQLIRIHMKTFLKILEDSTDNCLKILALMSQRLHGAIQEIDQLSLQNAKMRIIQFLLRDVTADTSTPHTLKWTTPKATLASRLSVRPETFSRTLQQLSQAGLIQVKGSTVTLLDIDALRQYR